MSVDETLKEVIGLTQKHDNWRKRECINLIASENIMSPEAERLYINDMMHRYAEGLPFKRYYQGHRYLDEVEVKTQKMVSQLFDAEFVDLRPISGTIANLAVFVGLINDGDRIMALDVPHGAHVSHTLHGALGLRRVKVINIPFDKETMNIDVDETIKLIEVHEPRLIILGASLFLFPHPLEQISEHAKAHGSIIMYDAAHVLGLIAGGEFQQPFKEGADIVTSSTHKTFPGPQGGLVMAKDESHFRTIQKGIFPTLVCNHHIHRIPALAQTTWEMGMYGRKYARQMVKNAKRLAETLAELGFNVLAEAHGFTESHQVVMDVSACGGGSSTARKLEENNIIANKNMIPGDEASKETMRNPSGIRLGVQEMTRWGCKESDMELIAELIAKCLLENKNVRDEVVSFRQNFLEVRYC